MKNENKWNIVAITLLALAIQQEGKTKIIISGIAALVVLIPELLRCWRK